MSANASSSRLITLFAIVLCLYGVSTMRCYSGMDKDIYAKDCPILTGTCYTIKYFSGTKEKGCDAIGCPTAIAKAKWYGGKYTCCDSDLCNGPHHPPQQLS